jgi:hypothetical protein
MSSGTSYSVFSTRDGTLTRTTNDISLPLNIDLAWSNSYSNGEFFIVVETIQTLGWGTGVTVKIIRHSVRLFNGGIDIYGSSTPLLLGDKVEANKMELTSKKQSDNSIRFTCTTKTGGDVDQTTHSFTINVIQAPDNINFRNPTLTAPPDPVRRANRSDSRARRR